MWRFTQILMFCVLLTHFNLGIAQINFPQGNRLNLETDLKTMYLETRIFFNTGKFKAEDYSFKKLADSSFNSWFISSCFNGDCQNGLPQSGKFINDYGINDTTCFIAFHVETFGIAGTSKIKYRVYNQKKASDSADLIFTITYLNLASLPNNSQDQLKVMNPMRSNLRIFYPLSTNLDEVILLDLLGTELAVWNDVDLSVPTPLSNNWKGNYILKISHGGKIHYKRILIE